MLIESLTTKKKLATAVAAAVAIVVVAAVLIGQVSIPVTVKEPLTLLTPEIPVDLYAGEETKAVIQVKNDASVPIPVKLTVAVSSIPEGGSLDDIRLTYDETLTLQPGVNSIPITIALDTDAVPGTYVVTVTIERTGSW